MEVLSTLLAVEVPVVVVYLLDLVVRGEIKELMELRRKMDLLVMEVVYLEPRQDLMDLVVWGARLNNQVEMVITDQEEEEDLVVMLLL
jgi:hypothetical protein